MQYKKFRAGEQSGTYHIDTLVTEEDILTMARQLARKRLAKGAPIDKPASAINYMEALLRDYEHEVFCVLFLDNRHRVIAFEQLFRGTIDGASVYPREVLKRALALNAAAVILAHCHPSGLGEPSQADIRLTKRLKESLTLVDIRTLDHVVVGVDSCVSMAERGLL